MCSEVGDCVDAGARFQGWILALPSTSCGILGMLLKFPGLQFLDMEKKD